jgi:DNA-binding MarR family transcriptional regulator
MPKYKRHWKKLDDEEFKMVFKLQDVRTGIKLKILKLLLDNDRLYQAEIARKLKKTSSGIRKYLKELSDLNIIQREKVDRHVYYSITEYGIKTYEKLKEYMN